MNKAEIYHFMFEVMGDLSNRRDVIAKSLEQFNLCAVEDIDEYELLKAFKQMPTVFLPTAMFDKKCKIERMIDVS